jgi:hypothetical protein
MMDNVCPEICPAPDWSLRREVEQLLEPHFRDLGWIGRASGLVHLRDLAVRDALEGRSTGVTGSPPGVEGCSNRCDDLTEWREDFFGEYMVDNDIDCELDDE